MTVAFEDVVFNPKLLPFFLDFLAQCECVNGLLFWLEVFSFTKKMFPYTTFSVDWGVQKFSWKSCWSSKTICNYHRKLFEPRFYQRIPPCCIYIHAMVRSREVACSKPTSSALSVLWYPGLSTIHYKIEILFLFNLNIACSRGASSWSTLPELHEEVIIPYFSSPSNP